MALTSLLRKAWLQSQISNDSGSMLQQDGQKLATIASVLMDEDVPQQSLSQGDQKSCNQIFLELQELVCTDHLSFFETAGEKEFGITSSYSDHSLAYMNSVQTCDLNGPVYGTTHDGLFEADRNPHALDCKQLICKLGLPNMELIEMLVGCARLMSAGHVPEAKSIIKTLIQHASPTGNATQRLVSAFVEALVARLHGNCVQEHVQLSLEQTLNIFRSLMTATPQVRVPFFFSNQNILKACDGFNSVHIVDYGSYYTYGFQWPPLICALASRPCGPPQLRITLIDLPFHGSAKKTLEDISMRLTKYAKSKHVNLRVHAIADKWENIGPSDLNLHEGDMLIINSFERLQCLAEESLILESPRKQWVKRVAGMKPKLFTTSFFNMGGTAPFFLNRLVDILPFFATMFDIMDNCMEDGIAKQMAEQFRLGSKIANAVSCEGLERAERPETYKRWHSRFASEGLQVLPPDLNILRKCEDIVASYQKPFFTGTDQGWLLLGWKGHITHALSAWTTS